MIKESGDAGTIATVAADCLLSATALDSEENNCAQWTWQVTDLEMSELYCKLDPLEHCMCMYVYDVSHCGLKTLKPQVGDFGRSVLAFGKQP